MSAPHSTKDTDDHHSSRGRQRRKCAILHRPRNRSKARSSRNAVSHDLASQQNLLMPGEESDFAAMHDTLLEQLVPGDGVEMTQFELALNDAWGLRRCRLIETVLLLTGGPGALSDPQTAKSFDRLPRCAAQHQRSFNAALRTLCTMRTDRLACRAAAGHQYPIPVPVPVADIDKRTRRITKRNDRERLPLIPEMKIRQAKLNEQTQLSFIFNAPSRCLHVFSEKPGAAATLLRREVA